MPGGAGHRFDDRLRVAPQPIAERDEIGAGDWLWRDPQAIVETMARAAGHLRLPESAA